MDFIQSVKNYKIDIYFMSTKIAALKINSKGLLVCNQDVYQQGGGRQLDCDLVIPTVF